METTLEHHNTLNDLSHVTTYEDHKTGKHVDEGITSLVLAMSDLKRQFDA